MKRGDIWIFLFALGVILFNWPFLTVFEGSLALGFFVLWGAFIAVAALLGAGGWRGRKR
jgi:hypothetical protein